MLTLGMTGRTETMAGAWSAMGNSMACKTKETPGDALAREKKVEELAQRLLCADLISGDDSAWAPEQNLDCYFDLAERLIRKGEERIGPLRLAFNKWV